MATNIWKCPAPPKVGDKLKRVRLGDMFEVRAIVDYEPHPVYDHFYYFVLRSVECDSEGGHSYVIEPAIALAGRPLYRRVKS